MPLHLIGNSPSSGSTLLADLIDSARNCACGPELNIFSNTNLYQHFGNPRSQLKPATLRQLHPIRANVFEGNLSAFGLDRDGLGRLLSLSSSIDEFGHQLSNALSATKHLDAITHIFEKTPQNSHCISDFLDSTENGVFVYIVRHPAYVVRSLARRGFSDFLAAHTWLFDVAGYIPFHGHSRTRLVRYEDLVSEPYQTTCKLLETITGATHEPDDLALRFSANKYRLEQTKRVASWSHQVFDGKVGSANGGSFTGHDASLISSATLGHVSEDYARSFGLKEISFNDAMDFFGYSLDVQGLKLTEPGVIPIDHDYRRRAALKSWTDLMNGSFSLARTRALFAPLR